jgi:hypothetical protein
VIKYRESQISAHHNYLVNDMLTKGFVVGDPNSKTGFYFLADVVLPENKTPRLFCRFVDAEGNLILELDGNHIGKNPGGYIYESTQAGFQILGPSHEPFFEVRTRSFPNGYISYIKGRLHDESGTLRIETVGESIHVHGEAGMSLDFPFVFFSADHRNQELSM